MDKKTFQKNHISAPQSRRLTKAIGNFNNAIIRYNIICASENLARGYLVQYISMAFLGLVFHISFKANPYN
jgi:hypothetical protein